MGRPPKPSPKFFMRQEVKSFTESRPHHTAPMKRFFTAAGISEWSQLLGMTRQQGAQARDAMRAHYKGASVYHAVSAARALLRHLTDHGVLQVNVLDNVRTTGAVSPIPIDNVLQPGQDEKILAAAKDHLRDYAVLAALLDHGFRASELANLTWEDMYQEPDGRWTVTFVGKMDKPARMRVKPRTLDALKAYLGSFPSTGPVIPKSGSTPLTRQDIWAIVRRWGKAIGSPVTPHGLRATYISSIYMRTRDVRKAQKMARHGSLSSTERYLRQDVLDED